MEPALNSSIDGEEVLSEQNGSLDGVYTVLRFSAYLYEM